LRGDRDPGVITLFLFFCFISPSRRIILKSERKKKENSSSDHSDSIHVLVMFELNLIHHFCFLKEIKEFADLFMKAKPTKPTKQPKH